MKISNEEMLDLVEKIRDDPSVLFLGQNYLKSYHQTDPFLEAASSSLCSGRKMSHVSQLWENLGKNGSLSLTQFEQLRALTTDIPSQWWLRKILSMRWGIIYSSAVDGCMSQCVGPNFSIESIPMSIKSFRREYIDKNRLHCCHLYGSMTGENEEFPPEQIDRRSLRSKLSSIESRISWIKDSIVYDYGVLVIDGWDYDTDWLKNLLQYFNGMPWHSVYLFSCTEKIRQLDVFQDLVEDEVLISDSRSFAEALDSIYFFDDLDTFAENTHYTHVPLENVVSVSVKGDRGSVITLDIPQSAIKKLPPQVVLIHDGLEKSIRPNEDTISEQFAQFLQQNTPPVWPLHSSSFGFHFKRNIDERLLSAVKNSLKKKSSLRRKTMVLEGPSNCGKTEALIHLALTLSQEKICPIIYIYSTPSQKDFGENLKQFIKTYLLNGQMVDNKFIDNIVIIWDGNEDTNAIQRYTALSSRLLECNAQVIGTVYRHKNSSFTQKKNSRAVEYISLEAELSSEELQLMDKAISRIDESLLNRYHKIRSQKAKNPNLLYILQQLSKYEYSEQWKVAAEAIRQRFRYEVHMTEQAFEKAIHSVSDGKVPEGAASELKAELDKIQSLENVQKEIYKAGFGAAWQLQLQAYMISKGYDSNSILIKEPESQESKELARLTRLRDDIHLINNILAMAGQFSVSLPLSLVFSCIKYGNGNLLSQEAACISSMLADDSLVDYFRDSTGQVQIQFRHPAEAEEYIRSNFGDSEQQLQEEVDLLCSVIQACNWDSEDSYDVIKLIRCFGTNSSGKYSESPDPGHYNDYMDYFHRIADCLDNFGNGPEAVLVAAHFRRERYREDVKQKLQEKVIAFDREKLEQSYLKLKNAIEEHDQHNRAQYNRLLVELCANVVASLPETKAEGPFDLSDIRNLETHFETAIHSWVDDDNSFSTNSLLDIWLNGFEKFRASFQSNEQALNDQEFMQFLSRTIEYIDNLLNLEAISAPGSGDSSHLLKNVDAVYNLVNPQASKDLAEKLNRLNNDTLLYMEARQCWFTSQPRPNDSSDLLGQIEHDLFFLPDDADRYDQLHDALTDLKTQAAQCAKNAMAILESRADLVKGSRRCLYMLLRCKWLLWTGNLLLEEKQKPCLTKTQWDELYELCNCHNSAEKIPEYRSAVLLLQGIYLWTYGNPGDAKTIFSNLRKMDNYSWFVERIGLCVSGESRLRQFTVDILHNRMNNPVATLKTELPTTRSNCNPNVCGRFGIHVSDYILSRVNPDNKSCNLYNLQVPMVIWFNFSGPSLGLAESDS